MFSPSFCPKCGGPDLGQQVPPGDTHERLMCRGCGYIHYINPKIIAGCIIEQDGKITAQGKQISAIDAKVTDPKTGLVATANGLNSLTSTVETLDGKVKATSEKVDGVYALVKTDSAGDTSGSAGDSTSSAGACAGWAGRPRR